MLFFLPSLLQAKEPDWSDYAALLKQHVKTEQRHDVQLNWISYSKIKQDPRWLRIIKQIETFSPKELVTEEERLAFYINVYNIMAMKVVIDNWPLKSIKDVGNIFWPVWKRVAGKVGGNEVTLDEIEHEILRPMGEPRIHFAIVCASISCPDLRKEPFIADKLSKQLDEQIIHFFNNPKKGLYQDKSSTHVSKIFSWFKEDFGGEKGVHDFIRRYNKQAADLPIKSDLPYNWLVNGN
ncbi:MAG: DUF547 domain-containing protein [Candidatus Marinimicrobia bacterium]|nr:DUF547 domain-containing protein [Candidatus Neomarinimicrobiota bacterium]